MSAYMVSRTHIAYLIDAAMSDITNYHFHWYWRENRETFQLRPGDFEAAAKAGQMLWDANKESIMARYPKTKKDFSNAPGPTDENYIYSWHYPNFQHVFDPLQVISACRSFDYQACEYEGWRESSACAFVTSLMLYAIKKLPGYNDTAWGAPESYIPAYPKVDPKHMTAAKLLLSGRDGVLPTADEIENKGVPLKFERKAAPAPAPALAPASVVRGPAKPKATPKKVPRKRKVAKS